MTSRESEKDRGSISLLVKFNQSGKLGEGWRASLSCNVQNSTQDLGFCKQHESSQCGPELEYSEGEQANLDKDSGCQHLYIIASTINTFNLNVQA